MVLPTALLKLTFVSLVAMAIVFASVASTMAAQRWYTFLNDSSVTISTWKSYLPEPQARYNSGRTTTFNDGSAIAYFRWAAGTASAGAQVTASFAYTNGTFSCKWYTGAVPSNSKGPLKCDVGYSV